MTLNEYEDKRAALCAEIERNWRIHCHYVARQRERELHKLELAWAMNHREETNARLYTDSTPDVGGA